MNTLTPNRKSDETTPISRIINNRYKIIEELGTGSSGLVYLVEDILQAHRQVALKTIKNKQLDKQTKMIFKREFEVMTRLKHPHITKVYDIAFDPLKDDVYITMEAVKGPQLKQIILHEERFPLDRILLILVDLCRALEFIRSRNIMHRDINPNNIKLDTECHDAVKLMDFGLADKVTEELNSAGTLGYLAPEVLAMSPSFKSDMFSLGCTIFELLTQIPFFAIANKNELVSILGNNELFASYQQKRLNELGDNPLGSIIATMTAFDPEQRYPSFTAIINQINHIMDRSFPFETQNTKEAYVIGAGFVGREKEIQGLQDQLIQGPKQGKVLWIKGSAGLGKTRLFSEFKNYCQLQGIQWFEGNCYEHIKTMFCLFLPILNELLLKMNQDQITNYGPELKKILPDHPSLKEIISANHQEPYFEHLTLIRTICDCLISCDRLFTTPWVIYLNDIHWADAASIDLLDGLLKRIHIKKNHDESGELTLSLYLSSREEGIDAIESLKQYYDLQDMHLFPFTDELVQQYFASIFGNNNCGPYLQNASKAMKEKVGGNPFFLQELIKSMIIEEVLNREENYWELVQDHRSIKIPDNLEDLILDRLNRLQLNNAQFQCLQILALLNRQVTWEEMKWIFKENVNLLPALEYHEVLKVHYTTDTFDYSLAHDLIKEILTQRMEQKTNLHNQIAQGLEELYKNHRNRYCEELSYHYVQANNRDKAIEYLQMAAAKACLSFENTKALAMFDTLIPLFNEDEKIIKVDIFLQQGYIHWIIGNMKIAEEIERNAASLARDLGDREKEAKAMWYIAKCMIECDQFSSEGSFITEVSSYVNKSISLYSEVNNLEGVANGYALLGYINFQFSKDYEKALQYYDQGLKIGDKKIKKTVWAFNLYNKCQVLHAQGRYDEAIEQSKIALTIMEEYNDLSEVALICGLLGFYHASKGAYAQAIPYYDREIRIAEEIESLILIDLGNIKKAEALFQMKRFSEVKQILNNLKQDDHQIANFEVDFMGGILEAKLDFTMNKIPRGKERLQTMLSNTENEYEIAKLNYELWRMSGEKTYRNAARQLYQQFCSKTSDYTWKERLKELEADEIKVDNYKKSAGGNIEKQFMNLSEENSPSILQKKKTNQHAQGELPVMGIHNSLSELYKHEKETIQHILSNSFTYLGDDFTTLFETLEKPQSFKDQISRNALLNDFLSVIRDVNSDLTLDIILSKIIDACIRFLNAQRGAVLLLNEQDNFEVKAARNDQKEDLDVFPVSSTVKNRMFSERKPIFLPDLVDDELLSTTQSIVEMKVRSIMCSPLEYFPKIDNDKTAQSGKKHLLGMIYLDSKVTTTSNEFSEENLDLLKILTDQASVAIYNAILNDRLRQTAKRLEKEAKERRRAEQEVRKINENLEAIVAQRTTELKEAQRELVDKARKAGMADIAASVLHNIGNTLNSIIISTQTLTSTLNNSQINNVTRANELLKSNLDNLNVFLTNDPKGKKLMEYYLLVGDNLQIEKKILQEHISRVADKTKVIEDIIVAQRDYATVEQQLEPINLIQILEDTCKLQDDRLNKLHITLRKEFGTSSMVLGNKVKIMHIMINLFENAQDAMSETLETKRILGIVVLRKDDYVQMLISDTGCGIEQKNLKTIFSHGYTTRKEKHGFGLHSCANYMMEMGGRIEAQSEGPGKGAIISLEFKAATPTRSYS